MRAGTGLRDVASWSLEALEGPAGRPASAAPLLRLLDGDEATVSGPGEVIVPHRTVVRLSDAELTMLTLPPRRDPTLAIGSHGAIPDEDFALQVQLLFTGRSSGTLVRNGAFVVDGTDTFGECQSSCRCFEVLYAAVALASALAMVS